MKILYLPLNRAYYTMIEKGNKREEYREMTMYWIDRLLNCPRTPLTDDARCPDNCTCCCTTERTQFRKFDVVCFSYGYTHRRMIWECKGISIGQGRKEWGAPDHKTFIIKLGCRLDPKDIKGNSRK